MGTHRRSAFAAILSLGAALGACTSGSGGATSSAGTSGTSGTGSRTSSTASNGSTSGGGSTTGSAAYAGTITLSQTPASAEQSPPLGTASVVFTAGGGAAAGCAGVQSGACCYQAMATSGSTPRTSVSAGTVAFTDSGAGIGHVAYGTTGYPPLTSTATPTFTWLPGDTLGVRNGGATVDKFAGTVVAPQAVTGLVPALSATAVSIPRGRDLAVSWTASGDTQLSFAISDSLVGAVTCTVADSAGTLTVPAALLGHFGAGDTGAIVVTRQNAANPPLSASNATVNFVATFTKFGAVTFQ